MNQVGVNGCRYKITDLNFAFRFKDDHNGIICMSNAYHCGKQILLIVLLLGT